MRLAKSNTIATSAFLSFFSGNFHHGHGFVPNQNIARSKDALPMMTPKFESDTDESMLRRSFLSVASAVAVCSTFPIDPAFASGGATAGKYTTIPIAKRRYYGRVQEAVHEFLEMGPAMLKKDMTDPLIQHFFDPNGAVIVEARRQDINGQCTKKNQTCKGAEIRDSRYNDMKASMYLLGNAFRFNQQKAPDNLPTVKAAKAFFKEVDQMEKNVRKKPKKEDLATVQLYIRALDILENYLDLVELPPTSGGNYDKEFSTKVGLNSRIT